VGCNVFFWEAVHIVLNARFAKVAQGAQSWISLSFFANFAKNLCAFAVKERCRGKNEVSKTT